MRRFAPLVLLALAGLVRAQVQEVNQLTQPRPQAPPEKRQQPPTVDTARISLDQSDRSTIRPAFDLAPQPIQPTQPAQPDRPGPQVQEKKEDLPKRPPSITECRQRISPDGRYVIIECTQVIPIDEYRRYYGDPLKPGTPPKETPKDDGKKVNGGAVVPGAVYSRPAIYGDAPRADAPHVNVTFAGTSIPDPYAVCEPGELYGPEGYGAPRMPRAYYGGNGYEFSGYGADPLADYRRIPGAYSLPNGGVDFPTGRYYDDYSGGYGFAPDDGQYLNLLRRRFQLELSLRIRRGDGVGFPRYGGYGYGGYGGYGNLPIYYQGGPHLHDPRTGQRIELSGYGGYGGNFAPQQFAYQPGIDFRYTRQGILPWRRDTIQFGSRGGYPVGYSGGYSSGSV